VTSFADLFTSYEIRRGVAILSGKSNHPLALSRVERKSLDQRNIRRSIPPTSLTRTPSASVKRSFLSRSISQRDLVCSKLHSSRIKMRHACDIIQFGIFGVRDNGISRSVLFGQGLLAFLPLIVPIDHSLSFCFS